MGIRLVITGGRDYTNYRLIYAWIKFIHEQVGIDLLIEGEARGADKLARKAAKSLGIEVKPYPALWHVYGRKVAGPIRNQQMIDEGHPDWLLAFMGGDGTADMTSRCRNCGLHVIETKGLMPDQYGEPLCPPPSSASGIPLTNIPPDTPYEF